MFMAKHNVLTKTQLSVVGAYANFLQPITRLTIQQNIVVIYHIFLMALVYFHFYNINGIGSSVSCMSNEVINSVMINNATYRNLKLTPSDVNMTQFFDENADLYIFRIVAQSPDQIINGGTPVRRNKGASRLA